MQEALRTILKHPYVQQFRDIRAVGLLVFGVIALLVSWSGVKVIQTNYDLQKQISVLEQEIAVQELENNNLALRNQYLTTDQYLELAARRQFGKGAPGETLILVPKEVALAHTVELQREDVADDTSGARQRPVYQKNLEAWMNFFMNREQLVDTVD